MATYATNPRIRIICKENGGKHTALNAGLEHVNTEFVGCLDADSFVTPRALRHIMTNFDEASIGAVTASMSVFRPRTILERMQEAEYLFGITLRHTLASVNALYVTPGPFTIFRKKIFDELGPFRPAHQTEDMEIAMRLQRAGWKIQNAPKASVFTKAPTTIRSLIKQRVRWTSGFLRNSYDYRDLIGNKKSGVLGLMILPLAVISIFSGIGLFTLSTYQFLSWSYTSLIRMFEVPLSFTFSIGTFDWFYIPINTVTIISALALVIVFIFIGTGAHIAEKKSRFGLAMIWYFILYTLIATVWRAKAVFDVVVGIRRSWR
jgi:cellulose synthase/poly-beta-1,6-N-acetylglucosamine synthase-like glycosyltransferase